MNSTSRIPRHAFVLSLAASVLITTFLLGSVALAQDSSVWIFTGSLNIPGSAETVTLLPNGKVLAVGGNSAELYEPATGTWSVTGSLNIPRNSHTATLLANGKVLVAGGIPNSGPPPFGVTNSAELYDPATGTWSFTGSLNVARWWYTATLLQNGKVLVVGGAGGGNSAELYDPENGTWTVTGRLITAPYGRYGQTATLLQNGEVLVAGGSDDGDLASTLASTELYNPATGSWRVTGDLNASRIFHTATLLPNGKVLVAGGYTPNFVTDDGIKLVDAPFANSIFYAAPTSLNNAELYDPATGAWSVTASLNTVRDHHTATLLPNGKVLVAGGEYSTFDGITPNDGTYPCGKTMSCSAKGLDAAELYDLATDTWSVTASLNTARWGHTATLLQNGDVLIAGGSNSTGPLDSAELALLNPAKLLGLTASLPSPQTLGASITFTATAVDGTDPLQYKWWVYNGSWWELVQNWSTSNSFSWTPTAAGNFKVAVWVRSSGNNIDGPENNAYGVIDFTVTPLSVTSLTADKTSPQPAGTIINFTAATTGGVAPIQYKWWVYNGSWWELVQNWSSSNSFSWTPAATGNFKVAVWVRSDGNTVDWPENNAYGVMDFTVTPLSVTNLTASMTSPQPVGSTITFTAATTGGLVPIQYKWWVYNGMGWSSMQNWSTSNIFNWTPNVTGNFKIAVWVRSGGNTIDAPENNAYGVMDFAVTPLSVTSLTADKTSPQPAGTTITFTAATTGGVVPIQYKWWVYNGSWWELVQNWSTSNSFSWTPIVTGNFKIAVWVRSNGNSVDAPENNAYGVMDFAINVDLACMGCWDFE